MRSTWPTSTFRAFSAIALLFALSISHGAAAHPARGIAVRADGRVYFSDLERIWEIGRDGRLRLLREHRGVHTHSLAIDRAGNLVGEESAYDPSRNSYTEAVWAISPQGRYRKLVGPVQPTTRGLGIMADARGCRYHADQTGRGAGREAGLPLLYRKCPRRAAELLLGSAAEDRRFTPALINDVSGVAWGPDGSFWFRQASAVRVLPRHGRSRIAAAGLAAENFGIAVDRNGKLYIAEAAKRRVLAVSPSGKRSIAVRSEAPWGPTGVALANGALFVLEATNYRRGVPLRMRVRRIVPGQSAQVLARVTVPE